MRLADATARENELFDMWNRTLRAKAFVEKERFHAVAFHGFQVEGSRLVFDLVAPAPEGDVGSPRQVKRQGRTIIRGEIESSSGTRIVLRIQEMDPSVFAFA